MNCKVTLDTVLLEQKRVEINELHKLLKEGMDEKQTIGLYSVAKKQIKDGLTTEELEEYERIVLERQDERIPMETQIE